VGDTNFLLSLVVAVVAANSQLLVDTVMTLAGTGCPGAAAGSPLSKKQVVANGRCAETALWTKKKSRQNTKSYCMWKGIIYKVPQMWETKRDVLLPATNHGNTRRRREREKNNTKKQQRRSRRESSSHSRSFFAKQSNNTTIRP